MKQRSKFRPCIDLHNGQVKQIVGGTLSDDPNSLKTNFVARYKFSFYLTLVNCDSTENLPNIMLACIKNMGWKEDT
jgi:phosphoribosylformimino-5-aminoimidazole carboxamide ribotide isomerase